MGLKCLLVYITLSLTMARVFLCLPPYWVKYYFAGIYIRGFYTVDISTYDTNQPQQKKTLTGDVKNIDHLLISCCNGICHWMGQIRYHMNSEFLICWSCKNRRSPKPQNDLNSKLMLVRRLGENVSNINGLAGW